MALRQSNSEETGLIEPIYTRCREVFAILCKHFEMSQLPEADKPRFSEQAGRFYLWGKSFYDGHIDTISSYSSNLHLTTVRFMTAIARLLLSRKSPV